jgi:hypothetical protein
MSAKSTAGPGGKKPTSAATNLIGKTWLEGMYVRVANKLVKRVEVQE